MMLNWNDTVHLRDGTVLTLEQYILKLGGNADLETRVGYLEDHAYQGGNLVVNGTLSASGKATFADDVDISGSMDIDGNIETDWGAVSVNGSGVEPSEPI